MKLKAEPCRLYVEQTLREALDAGRKDYEQVGREMFDFLTEHFKTEIKARSLAQTMRRLEELKAKPKIVTNVTEPKYTKAEKLYINQASWQAKSDITLRKQHAPDSPLPSYSPAFLKARSALSYLWEIKPDDPDRLAALETIVDYLKGQGFELVKPTTSKE